MFCKTLFVSLLAFIVSITSLSSATSTPRRNVVFILTDDQDAQLNSLEYMPNVQKLLVEQGTNFRKHYCTVALCCPSRVSLWTGKAAHNTNVTNVEWPYGKLMNAQNVLSYNKPFVKGFTGSDFLLDPNTYNYMNPIFQRNHDRPVHHNNSYSTTLVHEKAMAFLDDATQHPSAPFFLTIAPIAPHSDYTLKADLSADPPLDVKISPPVSEPQYSSLFEDTIVPRTPNFNPDVPSGGDWIAQLPQLSTENVTYNDNLYRQRLRALQSVDAIVADLVQTLEAKGILDNTYIFYTGENGYHIGQHRLAPGKGCGYEEDIHVPLVVRGPGVPAGKAVTLSTTHTDLAPTWWDILGIPHREDFDGAPISLTEESIAELEGSGKAKEHVQVEFWSDSNPQEYNNAVVVNNTYKGIRIVAEEYGFYYQVWCSGDHELYDMQMDADQMHNLYTSAPNTTYSTYFTTNSSSSIIIGASTYPVSALTSRLDAALLALKTCKGKPCTEPWETLLPGKEVYTLAQAMNPEYDVYFDSLPKVSWDVCDAGYIKEVEGPMWEDSMGLQKRDADMDGFVDIHKLARMGRHPLNRP